ncbi:MAG TPA: hypothetical protein VLR71_03920 [Casimicrobiaceae bacterium]|nr:hypothetical protein [Casimicrobiaceae bacterium]
MQASPSPLRVARMIEGLPLGAGVALVAVYVALYLAVAAVVHVLTPADPAPALARGDAPASVDASATPEHDHAQAR